MGKRVYIETYGCALNKADTLIMKSVLSEQGYEIVDSPNNADVVIINTCIVRYDTEVRMLKRIAELSKLGKKLVVAGCMARAMPAKIRSVAPAASLVPPQAVHLIKEAVESPQPTMLFNEVKNWVVMPKIIDGVIATIPVAEGCLDECSYCIVKVSRPHLRSVPIERVVEAIKDAVSKGAKEIEITAQDLSVYGYDLYGKYALPDLLRAILEIEDDFVIRIGQLNPKYLPHYIDEIIEILKDPRVYKHLHIPVQSGDNRVLSLMNRGYKAEDFINIVTELRRKIEGIHIATDIIVGHPGEDEEAFMATVRLIAEYEIDRVHIARYSPRPFTKAIHMPQVPDPVKKSRSTYIERVYEEVAARINMEYVGSRAEVIVTEVDPARGTAVGRLFNYRPVVLDLGREVLGKKAIVEITGATFYDLKGKVIEIFD